MILVGQQRQNLYEFHNTQSMSYGADVLVNAARKAVLVHAMQRRCA